MRHLILTGSILLFVMGKTAAQQNWAAVPCSKMKPVEAINNLWVDSLRNEIILYSGYGNKICNTTYKGLFAYNGYGFHDLDLGMETHDTLNPYTFDVYLKNLVNFNGKTIFGGTFNSVGSGRLPAKSIAVWNGAVWDTFPTPVFKNKVNPMGGGFHGFVKHNGKLWMYGGFDTIGNTITKNLVAYDGSTFTACPAIPVNDYGPITKMIVYGNKLVAAGAFSDAPAYNYWRLAQFDGTSWSPVGNGVRGNLSAAQDMIVYKDTLYIAGAFPKSDGNAGNNIMKWDGTQLLDAGFGEFCDYGAIWKMLIFKNRLYAFGGFSCAAGQKSFGIAYYENGTWTVPQDSVDNLITSAVVYNNTIYIGGSFKSINGDTAIQKFARLVCPDFDALAGCASSLQESFNHLDIKVYPNPANNRLYLECDPRSAIDEITILNTLGQELYRLLRPAPRQEIDISTLSGGVYFLKAKSNGAQAAVKLVKD